MEQYFATADLLKSSVPEFLSLYSKREGSEKQMVSHINILLNTAKTRHRGLTILADSIPSFSSNAMSEYGITWVKYCIVQHAGDTLKEAKLIVLVKLITCTSSNHDFDKMFVSDYLSKILEMCLESTSNHSQVEAALECLSACLIKYPNWFNPHTKKIENFLLKFLDHSSEDLVKIAGEAFHNLQQAGGGGLNKVNYINNFTTSFHKLFGNINGLLTDMSTDFTEIDTSLTELLMFDLTPIRSDAHSIDNYYKISQRLINCASYLKMMLRKQFSATKIIKPKIALEVIGRGLAMHICVCQDDVKHEDWHRSEMLKKIQIHLLYLLQMLLAWLKTNAFPYSYTISKILVDCLLSTDKCYCFKSNHLYFRTLNHVYVQWIGIIKGVHPNFQTRIFSVLNNNILPITSKISLNLDTNLTGPKSKKLKRKAIEEKILNSANESLGTQKLSSQEQMMLELNTATALGTLKAVLEVTVGIKKEVLQKLYRTTVGIALNIQAGRYTVPYYNIQCQVQLFKLLTAFLEQDHVSDLISIYPITRVLNNGARSNNKEISKICETGLRVVEKVCQPICPYITSVISTITQEDTDANIDSKPFNGECVSEYMDVNESIEDTDVMNGKTDSLMEYAKHKSSKTIKILSVQTIATPLIHEPGINEVNITTGDVSMEIDKKEATTQLDISHSDSEADNDVEFVREEVIISDDEPDRNCRVTDDSKKLSTFEDYKTEPLNQSHIFNAEAKIIETVNMVIAGENEIVSDCTAKQHNIQSEEANGEEDEDMFNSFVEDVIDN